MIAKNTCLLLCLVVSVAGCASQPALRKSAPPADPIAKTPASLLHKQGLAFASRGDFIRAQQYLEASMWKGFDSRVVVPELVRVCVTGSRLRAALLYGVPYLRNNPEDAGMNYVVGTIYLTLGNTQKAFSHLSRALVGDFAMADAAFSLALMAATRGDFKEQRKHLGHYLSSKPAGRFANRARHILAELSDGPQMVSITRGRSDNTGDKHDF